MREQMYQSGHRPGSWRVSQDIWDGMRLGMVEWMPQPTFEDEPKALSSRAGFIYGLPVTVDGTLPPNSVILEPRAAHDR